ncbi:MAG: MATE family efflux transporter [Eubacterium sp.]|nr:MATE family efflux transporter [Eubacterium sp.]
MRIKLSDHFNFKKLIRFVIPSVCMMIFTSIYSVVDGFFVSNYAGKTPFAALNLIYPLLMMLAALGFMIGTGGSAVVSKALGEGRNKEANEYFSLLVYSALIAGIIISIFGLIFLKPIAIALGADDNMLGYCLLYGRILLCSLPFFILQNVFQSFFVTAEKPTLGLLVTIGAGLTNIVLDYLLVGIFNYGLVGAAAATAASQIIGGTIPIIYFVTKNSSLLQLTKCRFYGRILLKTCTNGSSELMTSISSSLVNMLYNLQLMKLAGENGIAAYGVIMYVNFIFVAIFLGYSIGSAPIIGYHYGAENHKELKGLLKKSLIITAVCGILLTASAILLASPLSKIFVGYDEELFSLTRNGFRLFSLSFLITGFNIFASSFFTALGNGFVSAAISFSRTLLFQIAAVLLLPLLFGLNGIWLAEVAAEAISILVTAVFLIKNKNRYHY